MEAGGRGLDEGQSSRMSSDEVCGGVPGYSTSDGKLVLASSCLGAMVSYCQGAMEARVTAAKAIMYLI